MKILLINTVSGYGSTGRIVLDLTREISKEGNEMYIAYGQKKSIYQKSFKIGSFIENKFHSLCSRLLDRQGFYTTIGTKKLINYIREISPDIINLHNLHGNYINIKVLFQFLSKSNIPIIWTLHDCWPFTGHCAYFDIIDCQKWKTECNKCPLINTYPASYFVDNSRSNYHIKKSLFNNVNNMTIVTPSKWLAKLVSQSFLSKHEVKVINNGIDLDVFNVKDTSILRKNLNLENNIILLGVSAEGFEGRKGLKYFIELAESLSEQYKIILIGVNQRDKKQLPKNVISINRTNDIEQLTEYYSIADIFINPTLEDNFPTTNLEALACGTPVITFNTGGSPESVDDATGIVVEKNNTKDLISAIYTLNNQFKVINSRNCRKKAIDFYDKKSMYQNYFELYKNKLG